MQWLRNKYSHKKTKLIHFFQIVQQKNIIVQVFQKNDANLNEFFFDQRSDFLIENTTLLKIEYTCIKAFRMMLMKFDWTKTTKSQIIIRIFRINQCNQTIWSYRLICSNVEIEAIIMTRQKKRLKLHELTFNYTSQKTNDVKMFNQ